jgi:hypothetical protein
MAVMPLMSVTVYLASGTPTAAGRTEALRDAPVKDTAPLADAEKGKMEIELVAGQGRRGDHAQQRLRDAKADRRSRARGDESVGGQTPRQRRSEGAYCVTFHSIMPTLNATSVRFMADRRRSEPIRLLRATCS